MQKSMNAEQILGTPVSNGCLTQARLTDVENTLTTVCNIISEIRQTEMLIDGDLLAKSLLNARNITRANIEMRGEKSNV